MRQLHLQPRIKSSASQTEERLCMVPPGHQTQVAPPPAGSAPQQQTSPISHSQQRVLKRTQQSPEARGFCGWAAVRRGSKNKNTTPGHQTCTYAVPVNLHPPRPKLPCPENEHAARVTSHQGKPTATHIVEWCPPSRLFFPNGGAAAGTEREQRISLPAPSRRRRWRRAPGCSKCNGARQCQQ